MSIRVHDQESFDKAIAALKETGGRIIMAKGAYEIRKDLPANIFFEGESASTTILKVSPDVAEWIHKKKMRVV